ncbi:MAG: TM0106 family RecB-like putative nuclease [Microcoleaceae cyanobacterium]
MIVTDQQLLFYQRCPRRVFLDVFGDPDQKQPPSDFLIKLKQDSADFQRSVLADHVYEKPATNSLAETEEVAGVQTTLELMQTGVEQIAKGVLAVIADQLYPLQWLPNSTEITVVSRPDLLVKQPGYSIFGNWSYVPLDIRLGKRPKLDYQIVAAFHAEILAVVQGVFPKTAQLILREKGLYNVNLNQRLPQMQEILMEQIQMLQQQQEPEVFIARQKCSLCQWHQSCHQAASHQQHLSLLPGVTPNRYGRLQTLNLLTVEALAQTTPAALETYPEFSDSTAAQVIQQAQATWQDRAIRLHSSVINGNSAAAISSSRWIGSAPVELYFDIEAQPELNLDYLHGVLVVDHRTQTQVFHACLAENPEDEANTWQAFLELVWRYPVAPIYHFCEYEFKTIQRLARRYNTPSYLWQPLLRRLVDIHQKVVSSVTLPVESYALKPIAQWMGFRWHDPNANGAQCVYWYQQWLKTGDRTLLDTIVRYNEDDCRATYHVKQWLVDFFQN